MKKMSIFLLIIFILAISVFADNQHHSDKNYWKSFKKQINGKEKEIKYFVQPSIKKVNYKKGIIKARVEGSWKRFKSVELPEEFLEWSFSRRIETIEGIKKRDMPGLAGPHNAIVASHGNKRKDSYFSINNAVKGVGFIPRKEKIKEINKHLENTLNDPIEKKLDHLISMYQQGKELFDIDKQVSLELYTVPEFETHSFLNAMEDPGVAVVFLDIPSYELRAIAVFLDPNNPNLTDYERDVIEYINLIHSYFHGKFPKKYTAVIYYVVEVFNNSPGKKDGLGQEVKTR